MKLSDFDYVLPDELIARYPLPKRSSSRLLVLDRQSQTLDHKHFYDLPDCLNSGDLLVFNNSKVIPARLYGKKPTGGQVEILVERILSDTEVLAHAKASHLKVGSQIFVDEMTYFEVVEHEKLYRLQLRVIPAKAGIQRPASGELDPRLRGDDKQGSILDVLEKHGHMPLPPYMERADELADKERYQTVYAKHEGSIAAPTAGLHFDKEVLDQLVAKGVQLAEVTLHVGAGTFQPVKVDNIEEHHMHGELFSISPETVAAIAKTKAQGGRVIAVGTTSVRVLESYAQSQKLAGETHIFIYPGFRFKVIDGLITNFHLPKSSLLMLVSALASREFILQAYATAISEQYRFFSYGDAMLIM